MKAGISGQVPALDLRYHSHKITKGKYGLQGLPAMFEAQEDSAETLEVVLKDLYEEIYVTLLYGVLEKANVITRTAVIYNRGKAPLHIHRAMSVALDVMENDKELIHFYGKHQWERQY